MRQTGAKNTVAAKASSQVLDVNLSLNSFWPFFGRLALSSLVQTELHRSFSWPLCFVVYLVANPVSAIGGVAQPFRSFAALYCQYPSETTFCWEVLIVQVNSLLCENAEEVKTHQN